MDKKAVIRILRAEGIVHLRLFGSLARDEFGPDSDVDLIADLIDQSASLSSAWCILKINSPIF